MGDSNQNVLPARAPFQPEQVRHRAFLLAKLLRVLGGLVNQLVPQARHVSFRRRIKALDQLGQIERRPPRTEPIVNYNREKDIPWEPDVFVSYTVRAKAKPRSACSSM